MIEDKKDGIKIAENPKEALITRAIQGIEQRILENELNMEIDKKALEYLKSLVTPKTKQVPHGVG